MSRYTRRDFLGTAMGAGAALFVAGGAEAASRLEPVYAEIERRFEESVARLQS